MKKSQLTLYDCDRCKFTYKKKDLRKQRGMHLCDACFDTVLEIEPVRALFNSPRSNSTTTTAVNNPRIYGIGTAGVTALFKSQTFTREGRTHDFVMYVVGSPTVVTANPQIIAAPQGTLLTLIGTSDTNYVTLLAGNGTDLASPVVLTNGVVVTFVYNSASSTWWALTLPVSSGASVVVTPPVGDNGVTFLGDDVTFLGDSVTFTA